MDADDVAARIRQDVERRRRRLLPVPSNIQALADGAFLEAAHDEYHVELSPPGSVLRAPVRLLKAAVRRLLAPVLGRQVEFNAAVARLARETDQRLQALAERQEELRALVAEQAEELRRLRERP
jgi:hypothetical protein